MVVFTATFWNECLTRNYECVRNLGILILIHLSLSGIFRNSFRICLCYLFALFPRCIRPDIMNTIYCTLYTHFFCSWWKYSRHFYRFFFFFFSIFIYWHGCIHSYVTALWRKLIDIPTFGHEPKWITTTDWKYFRRKHSIEMAFHTLTSTKEPKTFLCVEQTVKRFLFDLH